METLRKCPRLPLASVRRRATGTGFYGPVNLREKIARTGPIHILGRRSSPMDLGGRLLGRPEPAASCYSCSRPSGPSEMEASTPQSAEKRRLHLIRERSAVVVRRAKDLRQKTDPLLRCESCGLSYREVYGERGAGFIEAHHKVPLAELRPGTPTRVQDLVLLCANCHRMIHRDPTLTFGALRKLVRGSENEGTG